MSGAGLDLYTYDALGNRMSRVTAERLEHYRYDPESGRLHQRIPDRAYDYDAGGRTTEDGRLRYRYGAEGRLAEITRAATGQRRAAYRYNALGERVRKLGTSVTYYHYDLEGRLLAETDAGGQTRAEYLYLGNEPLALSRSGQLYYYHNDHLGTPQKLTDGAGQVVWSASYRAFGEASIGVGYVTQNLRFPGQYYDEESGLHYNYHRYYDPGTGRYLQSDPIGLQGGLNTYLYANANPIRYVDPTGESALGGVLTGLGADLVTLEPTDVAWPKWVGWGVVAAGAVIYDMCSNDDEEEKRKKNCQALKDSILNTCYGLTGRKRMACFEAANTSYRQCMGYE